MYNCEAIHGVRVSSELLRSGIVSGCIWAYVFCEGENVMSRLSKSFIYKGFIKELKEHYGNSQAKDIWEEADAYLRGFETVHRDIDSDSRMMILPAASLYIALHKRDPENALELLKNYGTRMGNKIAGIVHTVTSIPGVSGLIWKNAAKLMRSMSSEQKGYTRKIVSESDKLVAVDILSCPLHDAAVKIGIPEVAQVVCAMDKAYMTGFRHIKYTRTTSVAEGDSCCDYRLSYDRNEK